jgi:alpha-D-xyloside xylohydrolase
MTKEMKEKGYLIGDDDASGRGLYDTYNKNARDLYWKWLNKNMFSIGMDAWWMDATDL